MKFCCRHFEWKKCLNNLIVWIIINKNWPNNQQIIYYETLPFCLVVYVITKEYFPIYLGDKFSVKIIIALATYAWRHADDKHYIAESMAEYNIKFLSVSIQNLKSVSSSNLRQRLKSRKRYTFSNALDCIENESIFKSTDENLTQYIPQFPHDSVIFN